MRLILDMANVQIKSNKLTPFGRIVQIIEPFYGVFAYLCPQKEKQNYAPTQLHSMNILIIGATSGIGHALYSHYVSRGNNVAIMGRRKDILEKLHAASPSNTFPQQTDISDTGSFNSAFIEALNSLKVIDLAIVCAGIGELNESLDIQQELTTLSVNVIGWTNVVDTLYNYFEKSGSGHLVTVTSVGGWQPRRLHHHTVRARLSKSTIQNPCKPRQENLPSPSPKYAPAWSTREWQKETASSG